MAKKYKGVIKFISTPRKKWAIVKEYKDTDQGAEYAYVTSTIAAAATRVATLTSTVAPNASEQFTTFSGSVYNIRLTVDAEGPFNIDVTGNAGVTTTQHIDSIIERINAAFTGNPASKIGSGINARIKITGAVSSYTGTVVIAAGTTNSCLAIFGAGGTDNGVTAECFNLTTNKHVKITVDGVGPTEINLEGSTPARTTITEILAKINAVFVGSASKIGSGDAARIEVKGSLTSGSGGVSIIAGTTTNALTTVFNSVALTGTPAATYEALPVGYRSVQADFSAKSKGDVIQYNYIYGNKITII